ncbi:aspartyl-tRNA(Asn)/glutamyl-tRNA(Gln) amidotransferase subunit A [Desulfobaculum xiamenense]|uniref:Glutamyl-tRNA(Gln) amidotransferase subunit A n=1 Tax=Desulfobaculum xiamenense TaxID=995050 RepID=A0A846QXU3_9BACT|nr:Asp-tRNA(Asn)/Glu-tRNA(Gln) amidotransferase subunit GatA [Desulfobaculum xiamenense]NJB69449.1 aspartyl-tRNA(Asn)/glutamyl-tRNA(Gln) amidotransferase subunit A [Desulfobaculum xiamenense]
MSELTSKTLTEIRDLLASREVSATDAVTACLDRIAATEPDINAFTSVQGEAALAQAKAMDAAGPDATKPLWGVPVSVKDILATKGAPTTCSSRILENFVPFYDATAVARLREAGAIIIGKTNMDEFAMGSSTENSAFGPTRNPWDTNRVPGGSSGGSAASVAARQCFGSLGTDTGGSIRQPASFCGCVGVKPTYGRVSRYGCVAYASSLDQIGPLTRTVPDAALMLSVIAGHDQRDSTSVDCPVPDYAAAIAARADLKGLRIGMPEEYWSEGLAPEVETACRAAMDRARELGATPVPVRLPHTKFAVATYYIVAMAEASSNLARFDGVRYGLRDKDATDLIDMYVSSRSKGFGTEVKRRIMLGTYVLSAGYYDAYYRKAAQVRRLIRQDFLDAFEQCDVICGPASPVTAWGIGEKTADPLQMYLMDIFTISLNLAGLPGVSIPVGLGADSGMPVGLQLLGPAFGEDTLLATADALMRGIAPLPAPTTIA